MYYRLPKICLIVIKISVVYVSILKAYSGHREFHLNQRILFKQDDRISMKDTNRYCSVTSPCFVQPISILYRFINITFICSIRSYFVPYRLILLCIYLKLEIEYLCCLTHKRKTVTITILLISVECETN